MLDQLVRLGGRSRILQQGIPLKILQVDQAACLIVVGEEERGVRESPETTGERGSSWGLASREPRLGGILQARQPGVQAVVQGLWQEHAGLGRRVLGRLLAPQLVVTLLTAGREDRR